MKLTKGWLKKRNACAPSYDWYLKQKTTCALTLFNNAIREKRFSDIGWVLLRKMNKTQRVKYDIFSAEQVIHIFENKYPDDNRPRKAIAAAKDYLKNPSVKTKNAAYDAVAADAVADAVAYTAAAKMRIKILTFGFNLLMEKK